MIEQRSEHVATVYRYDISAPIRKGLIWNLYGHRGSRWFPSLSTKPKRENGREKRRYIGDQLLRAANNILPFCWWKDTKRLHTKRQEIRGHRYAFFVLSDDFACQRKDVTQTDVFESSKEMHVHRLYRLPFFRLTFAGDSPKFTASRLFIAFAFLCHRRAEYERYSSPRGKTPAARRLLAHLAINGTYAEPRRTRNGEKKLPAGKKEPDEILIDVQRQAVITDSDCPPSIKVRWVAMPGYRQLKLANIEK
ncbi:hypothetical protein Trydic_g12684 [Trypoxylus dichotomus]